jgi:hypothetical protein
VKCQKELWITTQKEKERVRRPEVRWIDVVNIDMRKAGVINWRTEAKDRDK